MDVYSVPEQYRRRKRCLKRTADIIQGGRQQPKTRTELAFFTVKSSAPFPSIQPPIPP